MFKKFPIEGSFVVKVHTPAEELKTRTKVNLGCGADIKEGWINIDIAELTGVDISMNIETERIPLEDQSVEYVLTSHVLEHIRDLGFVLREVSRILKPGGEFYVIVPAFSSSGAFQDPTHVRFFTDITFRYISGDTFDYYYGDLRFKLRTIKKKRTDYYKQLYRYLRPVVGLIGKKRFNNYVDHFLLNMISEYHAIFEKF